MSGSRIAKTLARGAVVAWRDQPTQYDIEALRSNIERVGLVIRLRWAVLIAFIVFSVIGSSVYATSSGIAGLLDEIAIPGALLLFVLAYNTVYQLTYRKVGNLAFLNQAQLLFDMFVATVLVYYSGGVYSWFNAMYLLFILEAAFILRKPSHVWALSAAAAVMYGVVLFGEYLGVLPHVTLPFVTDELHTELTYVLMRFLWNVTLFGGSASVGLLMMRTIRERESELARSSFVDDLTGLYNRPYFYRVLSTEVERSNREGHRLGLLLADIDRFGELNRTFGVEVGDDMLAVVAERLRAIAGAEASGLPVSVACRVGGEELALIVPEMAHPDSERFDFAERLRAAADEVRGTIGKVRAHGVGVTVSIGLALLPEDGTTPDALLDAADRMLSRAAMGGGNRVCATWDADCQPGDDAHL